MSKFWFFIIVILLLWLLSFLISNVFKVEDFGDKIAIIPIKGVITTDGFEDILRSGSASSTSIVKSIQKANSDSSVKGMILEINSPGGTVVASKEIANEIKKSNKPVVALIREVGASGAYWIASSSNKIIADPLSITGSIGVIGSYLEFSELMEEYGVGYERLVAGDLKDAGSPFRKLSEEEKSLLQSKLDIIHEVFIDEVAENRNLDKKTVRKIANGFFYLGKEAKELGLVDELGDKELAINITKELANVEEVNIVRYEEKRRLSDILSKISAYSFYFIGRGIGKELFSLRDDFGFIV
ncbi:MAG: signal peptide peptidase SppA [Candidatus Nanoarchaeia archaeon]|jgi:protease-4|nr:signal peptide peptidase SppA [Candidatus Nanoarchaeia archaeon]|tara:strand:+ start:16000 stop:16896 length:897 start_codon:yes stop_codon:yes gene_type:complete